MATWSAVLARVGRPTGDGRIIDPAGVTFRDLPMPLMWQEKTAEGHDGSVTVGAIESVEVTNGMILGKGSLLNLFPDRERLIELINAGVVGPSVDLADDVEYVMDDMERILITRAGVGGATLVPIEAFADVSIQMDTIADEEDIDLEPAVEGEQWPRYTPEQIAIIEARRAASVTASVRSSGWSDMPITDESRAWDGSGAANRVFEWATDGDTTDWSRYARAFVQKKDGVNPETKGAYGYGIADVINGTLTIVPRGVFAAAAAVQGSRGSTPGADADGIRRVLSGIYRRLDRTPPWAEASLAASAAPPLPPVEWFAAPKLDGLTPLTVTPEGRVFGHVAGWSTCHVGLPGCVTPPSSESGYAYFHVGAQRTAEGVEVPVGTLTVGGGHADAQLGFRAAADHYDSVGAAVARVVASEDAYGICVAGYLIPGADPVRQDQFLSSPVSGDWRRIGGSLEMIAVCAVNTPGFPVPRARVAFSNGAQQALVGTFGVQAVKGEMPEPVDESAALIAMARWAWQAGGI